MPETSRTGTCTPTQQKELGTGEEADNDTSAFNEMSAEENTGGSG